MLSCVQVLHVLSLQLQWMIGSSCDQSVIRAFSLKAGREQLDRASGPFSRLQSVFGRVDCLRLALGLGNMLKFLNQPSSRVIAPMKLNILTPTFLFNTHTPSEFKFLSFT